MNSAMRRSTRTASCSTTARSGSTGARWSRSPAAPTAMPASAGTPAAACWKWAATWPPAGARQANGWPRAAPPPSPAARWSPAPARTSTCPAARWTCRTGTSARAGCAAPTAASTTCRARPATCSTGLYKGFEQVHQRWGDKATRVFYNPLIGPRTRFENGYTVGRDAGALIVSTGQARLDGGVTGESTRARARPTRRNGTWTAICSRRRPWRAAAA